MTTWEANGNMLEEHKIYMFALDPVHVGAGGTQLGYVDNMIVRDPGDNLPKIPGTAMSGMARAHAARQYNAVRPDKNFLCAGQGTEKHPHCGKCPVCRTFGTSMEGSERQGAFSFQDALILLFPVYSFTHGPVWVGSSDRLQQEFGQNIIFSPANATPSGGGGDASHGLPAPDVQDAPPPTPSEPGQDVFAAFEAPAGLALGRRLVKRVGQLTFHNQRPPSTGLRGSDAVLRKGTVVAVPDSLFCRIVNENLEVRTSVSIDPFTGAAAPGALFTYEALPRGTVLVSGGSVDLARWTFRGDKKPGETKCSDERRAGGSAASDGPADLNPSQEGWETPAGVVRKGLSHARLFGLGGMVTRGFGRVDACMLRKP